MLAEIEIRLMRESDIERIVETFAEWHKRREQYQEYFWEQQRHNRTVLIAWHQEKVVGYLTIVWTPNYEYFRCQDIPEIVDLNVITPYQQQGIGTHLVRAAEQAIRRASKTRVGISVEQSPMYAAANDLYPKLGYIPDGNGVTAQDNELHLVKSLDKDAG